ncbi:RHS repeat domain-containing protein [Marilutibacter alkalisoli]|nr:RHS repeat-associated core domain-containing protein [Lysobacter alkalisoli]
MAYKIVTQNSAVKAMEIAGESISLVDRKVQWNVTDMVIPGNGLPIEVSRSHRLPVGGLYDNWRGDMYNWELSVPRIAMSHSIYGLNDHKLESLGCITTAKQVNVMVNGEGDFRPIAMNASINYPKLSSKSPHAQFNNNWLMYCGQSLTTRSNSIDELGQPLPKSTNSAITLVSPDGVKYHFAYFSSETKSIPGPKDPDDPSWGNVVDRVASHYVTDIEDRFGNHLTFHYEKRSDNWRGWVLRLQEVSASDGRRVTLDYHVDDHGQTGKPGSGRHLKSITSGNRTVSYAYRSGDSGQPQLHRVTDADGRFWEYNYYPLGSEHGLDVIRSVTIPSGAVISYEYELLASLNSDECKKIIGVMSGTRLGPGSNSPGAPYVEKHPAVLKRSVADGSSNVLTQDYSTSWNQDANESGKHYIVTRVTGPQAQDVYHHVCYDVWKSDTNRVDARQLALVKHETFGGSNYATLLRNVETEWKTSSYSGDYRLTIGYQHILSTDRLWQSKVITRLGSDAFTRVGSSPNAYGQLMSITRNSSIGYSRSDRIDYHNSPSEWIIGQVKSVTNVETGKVVSQTDYDWKSLPWKAYEFTLLKQTFSYSTTDGMLKSITDGLGNVTTLANWKRGIPQKITYADGKTQSAVVNNDGTIASVTDENGYKTCYAYDAMGRLSNITYPSESSSGVCDATTWNATTLDFSVKAGVYGLPNHWRRLERTGSGYKITRYDALWRPVVEESYDNGNSASTRSIVVKRYDAAGRLAFQSYPVRTLGNWTDTSLKGIKTSYDALDRVTYVKQDSELDLNQDGIPDELVTRIEYLSNADGYYTRVTNPRGQQTLTWYQAFDQPSYDSPVTIRHPAGARTHITRDVFGKPTKIRRSNSNSATDGTVALDRTYTYNSNQELCRVVEPETGATLMGYDAAGNLAWSAAGLPASTACHATGNTTAISARRAIRTYDERNRIKSLSFPDNNGNTTHTYTADGLPDTVTVNNNGGSDQIVTTTYGYNRRRLLTSEQMALNAFSWPNTYRYNANGHLIEQGYPAGQTIKYAVNALGQTTRVYNSSGANYASGVSYHPNGAIAQFTYGNGITHTLTQNARGLPDTSTDAYGTTKFLADSYDYDGNANVAAITDGATGRNQRGNRDMVYDGLNRLTSVSSPMFGTATYAYNVLDDLTRVKLSGGAAARDHYYCYGSGSRLAFVRSGSVCSGSSASPAVHALSYDVQGNLKSKDNHNFSFDYGNRLRSAKVGSTTSAYVYDGQGRRMRDSVNGDKFSAYIQDGKLVYDFNSRQKKRHWYVYLSGSLVAVHEKDSSTNAEAIKYQHTDALGSPVAVTDESRVVIERSEYEPYGKVLNRPLKDGPGYTGHVEDAATGLIYAQQRYYDDDIGRFLSVDPVTPYDQPVIAFNRYRYANNNPYGFTDPDGRQSFGHRKDISWWNIPAHVGNWFAETRDLSVNAAFGTQAAPEGALVEQYEKAGDAILISQTLFLPGLAGVTAEAQGARYFSAGVGSWSKRFFEGAKYSERTLSQTDKYHAFPKSVDGFAREFGKVTFSKDSRGVTVEKLTLRGQMEGSKGWVRGTFEYVKNQKNEIYHRLFKPDKVK